jgi:tetrathionate reductase subunit B
MHKHKDKKSKSEVSRRDFIKTGSAAAIAIVGTAGTGKALAAIGGASEVRLAMLIDLKKCIGCKACTVACKSENGVRLGGFRSWVSEKEVGKFPKVKRHYLPRLCNQCQNPACLKVCPTGATYQRDDGLINIDKDKCIGCRHCMGACPYNARYFNPAHDEDGVRLFPALTHGTVDKCNFCAHRVDNKTVPSCVNTCPADARIFGDLNDAGSEIYNQTVRNKPARLLTEFGTEPSVYYSGDNPQIFKED